MARDTPVQQQTNGAETDGLPNLVTLVGCGVPSNFEITVDGELEMLVDDPVAEATIVSGGTAEGAIEVGVHRFRFSGDGPTSASSIGTASHRHSPRVPPPSMSSTSRSLSEGESVPARGSPSRAS